jgi:hypothetical protein
MLLLFMLQHALYSGGTPRYVAQASTPAGSGGVSPPRPNTLKREHQQDAGKSPNKQLCKAEFVR